MLQLTISRVISFIAVILLASSSLLSAYVTQNTQVSPTPSANPTVSPSPTPTRSPSPTPLPGAQNFHQWGSITVFNGLPSDSVRAIAQTPDGVMWFGTDNGLVRFDGRRVQNFPVGDVGVDSILALKVSELGQLWVGTRAGAFVFSDTGFKLIQNTETSAITAIQFVTPKAYLGTQDGDALTVYAVTDGSVRAISATSVPELEDGQTAVTSLVEQNGTLLAATSGRGVFSLKNNGLYAVQTPPSPGAINALATRDGSLWLGTDATKGVSGIYRSTAGERFERVAAPTSKVLALETNDGGVWAGTERYGLFQFDGAKLKKNYTFENTSGGLRSNTIYALFTDREGVLWIGTNRGVSRFDRSGAMQQTVSDSPNGNFIRTLFKTNNGQVFAGSNRGLFRLEKETWRSVPGFEGKVIYAISGGKNLDTLIATSTGLFDLSGRQMLSGDARDIADFRSRMYAAVFGRGIVQVPNGSGQMQVISSDETSTSVFEGVDRLWIGTAGKGLFSFDGNSVKQEITPDTLKSGTISKMRVAVDGSLWIAGQHGVFRVVNGKPERIFEVDDVRDVYLNGDEFWAATTTRGLIHGRRDDRFGWIISAIGFEQGLPSEKAFSILPTDDGLLIATNRGVVTYKPGTVSPKIIATRFLSQRVHDLSELRSKIELDYPQNSLLLEVAGQSSRTFPEEFQYAFVLKNAKGEEVARQLSNEAQYAPRDLAAGDYTIQVTAFNRDLLPSEPLTISFSVASAPFPWMATALGVLLAIAVIGLVWAAFEHRRIRQRNRELAAARFDLANEAERERSRIARDLHDQTLADLRLLMMRSDKGELSQPELRHEIESVSTEIRRICEDLSPSVLENVGLVPALEFLLSQTVDDHAFSADEGIEDRIQFPLNAQLQIYRIAQEVLANIRRHSNADHVEMSVTAADHEFRLSISDNGTAFQPDSSAGKGRGIANIRSRANLIGGRVAWKESSRGGNTFTLKIDRS